MSKLKSITVVNKGLTEDKKSVILNFVTTDKKGNSYEGNLHIPLADVGFTFTIHFYGYHEIND